MASRTRLAALAAAAAFVGGALAGLAPAPWAPAARAQGAPLLAGERPAAVQAIAGVVAAGAQWELAHAGWQAAADGLVGDPDGGLLFAEEQSDSVRKLDASGGETIVVPDAPGVGAVSMDTEGRIYGVLRTCTDPGKPFHESCAVRTAVAELFPVRRVVANGFRDGRPLGRLNDLAADGKGGAYFTVGRGVYHTDAKGKVEVVEDQNLRPNGLILSRDGRVLYVSNDTGVVAFDVRADGGTANRRDFGGLGGDKGGDGMAIDSEGRVYVTAAEGVHVLSPQGAHLGMIPTHRRAISVAFGGPDKKSLYISELGAVGPDGKDWKTPPGVRNVATTIHRLPMLAQGFAGRPK